MVTKELTEFALKFRTLPQSGHDINEIPRLRSFNQALDFVGQILQQRNASHTPNCFCRLQISLIYIVKIGEHFDRQGIPFWKFERNAETRTKLIWSVQNL